MSTQTCPETIFQYTLIYSKHVPEILLNIISVVIRVACIEKAPIHFQKSVDVTDSVGKVMWSSNKLGSGV